MPSAATMTLAWAVLTWPAAIASASTGWCSRASASMRSDRAARRVCRVCTATQAETDAAPVCVQAPLVSASASSRSLKAASLASALAIATSPWRFSRALIDSNAVVARSSRAVLRRSANPETGWVPGAVSSVELIPESNQGPPTQKRI